MSKVITLANPVRLPSELHYKTAKGNKIVAAHHTFTRVVPVEEVAASDHYWDMAPLAIIFNHDVVEEPPDEDGRKRWRWRQNLFMDWIHDYAPVYSPSSAEANADGDMPYSRNVKETRGSLDLNNLVSDLHCGMFTMEEWMKFYMQIGYSLSGYGEVFGQHEACEYGLPGAKEPEGHPDVRTHYTETVIDYMTRIHAGKVLKL